MRCVVGVSQCPLETAELLYPLEPKPPSALEAGQQCRDESTINRICLGALESVGRNVTTSVLHNLLAGERGFTAT